MKQENKLRQIVFRKGLNPLLVKRLFGLSLCILFYGGIVQAQGVPRIGNQLEFAGVTIHLTETTQHSVQQEAELLYVNRALVTSRLERMNLYFPVIRPFLAQHSLSDDFLFLALYDNAPVSDEPSTAFWALGKTNFAKLRIDAFVDERQHPVPSTLVAISQLKQLYQQKPNWVSVLQRYGQLVRADTTRSGQEPGDGKSYALNDTKDEFLIRLLASKIVLERAWSVYHPQKQLVLFPYEESKGKRLKQIADHCQVNEAGIVQHNAWLKAPQIPENEAYTVYLPVTIEQYAELKRPAISLQDKQAALPDAGFPVLQKKTTEPDRWGGRFYQINGKKGIQAQLFDNRITLAYQGKLKVKKFQRYNDLRSDRPIVAGEIYYLRKKNKRAKVPFHVVRRGQSLWAIAQQYGIKLDKLIDYNGVNPEQQPAVARVLWLQKKRPATMPIEYYRLQPTPSQSTSEVVPVLAVHQPDAVDEKPIALTIESTDKSERIASAEKVPNGSTLAELDSLITALHEPQMPLFRSGSTKMIKPLGKPEKVIPAKETEDELEEVSGPLIMHTTEKTDTYASVARKYNVTVEQLYVWNNLSALKPLRAGQSLLIDQSQSPVTNVLVPLAAKPAFVKPAVAKPVKPLAAKPAIGSPVVPKPVVPSVSLDDEIIHVVQAGENMYRIGLRYKVKPEQVQKWNNLPNLTAVVGARLVIYKK